VSNIVVIGSGVVGEATGRGFMRKGHRVTFVDVKQATIERLRAAGLNAGTLNDVNWHEVDIVMLAVSTPSVNRAIVLDYIEQAAKDLGEKMQQINHYITIVVRSTVPPTTTEQRLKPIIESASGKVAGEDFGLAMNPEFLRQVSNIQDFDRPWITVLGIYNEDINTAKTLKDLYMPFQSLIVECNTTEAEMIKYTNNLYNAVKISYFNEVHALCERLGINSGVVSSTVARSAESMWNPLYGTRGGVPYGGACLPKDTEAFMAWCNQNGFEHLMLEATIDVNDRLSNKIAPVESPDKIESALFSQKQAMSVNGHKVS
jgi:UDPglucose 6-dehydrogenase